MAVGKPAVPIAVLDIEGGAGGDELLDHGRVAVIRGPDERSVPAETYGSDGTRVRPMQSAHGPYP